MIVPVTAPEYQKGQSIFAAAGDLEFVPVPDDEETLVAFVAEHQCRAAVLGVQRYSAALYGVLPPGSILVRFGVGTDSIDFEQARARGILVANTPGALDRSVAEHTIFLIGALARNIGAGDQALKAGAWAPVTGDELADFKLGIVGLGNIGYEVARIAQQGFGVETLICEITPQAEIAARHGQTPAEMAAALGYTWWTDQLAELVRAADIISVHLPVTPHTRGMFSQAIFSQCKPGSLFVNTSRGALVVEQDLAVALQTGQVRAAALDVYEQEPYQPAAPNADLRRLPNVILTPHVASNTRAANRRMAAAVIRNLRAWVSGDLAAVSLA